MPLIIESSRIPTIATGTAQLLMRIADGDLAIREIISLVETSPTTAAKLIACANSAWSNPVTPVSTVEQACTRLGLDVIRTTVVALAVGKSFDPRRCPTFDVVRFWTISMVTASLASAFAQQSDIDPKVAQASGLLRGIGLLWLADALPGQTAEAIELSATRPDHPLGASLALLCGMDHKEAAFQLYDVWGFPDVLKAALGLHSGSDTIEYDQRLARIVQLASELASQIFLGIELEDSSCPAGVESIAAAYERQRTMLSRTLELAERLFT